MKKEELIIGEYYHYFNSVHKYVFIFNGINETNTKAIFAACKNEEYVHNNSNKFCSLENIRKATYKEINWLKEVRKSGWLSFESFKCNKIIQIY